MGQEISQSAKDRTIELYESLPQNKAERIKQIEIRDEIIHLNYSFFGYIASKTFINNSAITYEDKFQSALTHFCECWWWWKWQGDETHKGYRSDLSFTSFYKLRVAEMIERELNEVKYSVRRALCMEVGAQLGKHWGQVKYEDLAKVKLPPDKMIALKAIFGSLYTADFAEHEIYMSSELDVMTQFDDPTDEYDSIVELLIHDMIVYEEKLDDVKLQEMADMYGLPFSELKKYLPEAESKLYAQLHASLDKKEIWGH